MLYRTILPAQFWYSYLVQCCPSQLLCSLLAGSYLALKVTDIRHYVVLYTQAVAVAMRSTASWGTYVGVEAPAASSDQRPGSAGSGMARRQEPSHPAGFSPVISAIAASLPVELQAAAGPRQSPQQAPADAAAALDVEAGASDVQEGICPICHVSCCKVLHAAGDGVQPSRSPACPVT